MSAGWESARCSTAGQIESDPGNPLANAQGEVRVADVNLGSQMVGLIQAQETYQANATTGRTLKELFGA